MYSLRFVFLLVLIVVVHGQRNFTLVVVDDIPTSLNAVCLDGTNPGYYWRPALQSTNQNNWMIYIEGGGWCISNDDCLSRAGTFLGSTKYYAPQLSDEGTGMFSSDPSINPDFYDWNIAYLLYCDGGSFSGNLETPVVVNNSTIWFRGHAILTGLIQSLLKDQSLGNAEQVLISGCSAGGLSTYLHADYIASMLPSSAVIKAAPDSGFFLNLPNSQGQFIYADQMAGVFQMQNATSGVSSACISDNPQDTWTCIFAASNYGLIKTPIFLLQSTYDAWQIDNIAFVNEVKNATENFNCAIAGPMNCTTEQMEPIDLMHFVMLSEIQSSPTWASDSNGGVLFSCFTHCAPYFAYYWSTATYGNPPVTLAQALGDWYFDRTTTAPKVVDCYIPVGDHVSNCNPSCNLPSAKVFPVAGSLMPDGRDYMKIAGQKF